MITMSWNAEDEESRGAGQVVHLRFMAAVSGNVAQMIRLTSLVTEAEAVSYTHLDVYKRQVVLYTVHAYLLHVATLEPDQ